MQKHFIGKRVAVLMGGKSGERKVSLRSGKAALNALKRQGIDALAIDAANDHLIEQLNSNKTDIVFIALHGRGGEDGSIQGLLESLGLPYTGSKVLASALAMNKVMSKLVFKATNVPTPDFITVNSPISLKEKSNEAIERLGLPLVIKPTSEGSSLGISIVKERSKVLPTAQKTMYQYNDIFFEKYIKGKEVTVGLLGKNDNLRALPVLELVPKKEFYDYEAKYTKGMTEFIIPARLSTQLTAKVQEIALLAHRALGCHGMSRVDMMIDLSDERPYVTDVNTIPGLTDLSDLPAEAEAIGMTYDELIIEILSSAIS